MSLYADDLVKIEALARRVVREELGRLVSEEKTKATVEEPVAEIETPASTSAKQTVKQAEKTPQQK